MKSRFAPIAAACALWLCAAAAVAAPPPSSASSSSAQAHPANLDQAVKHVRQKTHGHILAADQVARGRVMVYRIKVLTPQGQVKVVQLHSEPRAKSGKHDSDQGGH